MVSVVQTIINALSTGGLIALFTLGIALLFGVMGLINFAHGELIMVGGFAMFYLGRVTTSGAVIIAGAVVIVILLALLIERVAFRPIRAASQPTLLITSFAVSYFLQNLALLIAGGIPRSVSVLPSLSTPITFRGIHVVKLSIVTIAVAVVLMAALGVFLRRTRLGIQMRAAAEDFEMARALGVRANAVIAAAFALSGVFAATASVLFVAQIGTLTPTMGFTPVLLAFVATIIGGLGSLRGAVLGGLVVGSLTVCLQTWLPLEMRPYRDAFVFGGVLAILVFLPGGLGGLSLGGISDRLGWIIPAQRMLRP